MRHESISKNLTALCFAPPGPALLRKVFFLFVFLNGLGLGCALTQSPSSVKEETSSLDSKPKQSKVSVNRRAFRSLTKGHEFFQKGDLKAARVELEKLNYQDPGFIPALIEIQKINYIQQDWNRLFGLAVYYRKKLLSSHEMSVKNFSQEMPVLEILALIRHCRFAEALKIMQWSLSLSKAVSKDNSKIHKAAYFFKLKSRIKGAPSSQTDWTKQIRLWPVEPDRVKWLSNPKKLRVKVNSQC